MRQAIFMRWNSYKNLLFEVIKINLMVIWLTKFYSGFTLVVGFISASPFPQQSDSQSLKQPTKNSQNVPQKDSQAQLRSSFSNREYYRPSSGDGFGPSYSDYEDTNSGYLAPYYGYRPNSDRGFASNYPGFGNRPSFGGWNRPIRPRPVFGGADRGFGGQTPGSTSSNNPVPTDGNQLGSGGVDNQPASGDSGNGNQGSDNVGGSGTGNDIQPQTGGQPWTTVRAPVNRIFGEYTIPEIAECIRTCPSVSQYDPICGSDNITYTNRGKFQCAQRCGRGEKFLYLDGLRSPHFMKFLDRMRDSLILFYVIKKALVKIWPPLVHPNYIARTIYYKKSSINFFFGIYE